MTLPTAFNRDAFNRGAFNRPPYRPPPGFVLLINGLDRTDLLDLDSLQIKDVLGTRNSCLFTLTDIGGTYRPRVGQDVTIKTGDRLEFAGTIDDIDEHEIDGTPLVTLVYEIEAVDFCQLADRHTVARIYEGETAGDIVQDIIARDLAGEEIGIASVQDGPVIERAVFNYATAAEAFDEICRITGFSWYIDYQRRMHFFSRETNACPVSLTDDSQNYFNMRVHRTRERYRNVQFIRAGKDVSTVRTESFKGDGVLKTFVLSLPVAKVPTVKVNGFAKTVGIRLLESGKDWYWSKEEKEITQDDAAAALTDVDTLEVTYQGLFPILIKRQSGDEIASRRDIEYGSGIYEAIESEPNIDDRAMAIDLGDALIRRYGLIPTEVTFSTDEEGIRAGQLISITNSRHNISGDYLIQSVNTSFIQTSAGQILRSRVSALSGEAIGGWLTFFQDLLKKTEKFVIRENEVLILLATFEDSVACSDTLTVTARSPESRVGYAIVGYSEVGVGT